ncbi:MAG: hypothetical protein Q8N97_11115 [Methanobacteriaceae archaeon]|nr:hypothetical protein [Methanobacteriaceae archaeon]MDP3484124.1 hypothetical protein [Methanobacteriaceae archaeon]MDP3623971.1 hypothetical protein [Methanobacteriaceae archaeon]
MLLPYEPLIKIAYSKIKCYNHKTQKKVKTGEIHTYNSKQYVIPLKNDQPFSCAEEVVIIKAEDYFRMDKLLQQRKLEYDDYLERNIALERELKELKVNLKYYTDINADTKISKLMKIEKEYSKVQKKHEREYLEILNQLKGKNNELLEAKKEINSKEDLIKELKREKKGPEEGFLGKMRGIFPKKISEDEKRINNEKK